MASEIFCHSKYAIFGQNRPKNELFLKKYAVFTILRAIIKNYMLFYLRKIHFDPYFQ